jgi:H+-transporting ATPase
LPTPVTAAHFAAVACRRSTPARVPALSPQVDKEKGMTEEEAEKLREQYGFNELQEKKVNPFLLFLGYLWGPMPCMIWAAIIIELAKSIAVGEGWEDFSVLMVLQFANATGERGRDCGCVCVATAAAHRRVSAAALTAASAPRPPALYRVTPVGFIEERNAGDAIAALKSQLAPQCHVCRGGEWKNMPARLLVPGACAGVAAVL